MIEIQPGHPTLPSPTQHIVLTPLPKSKLIAKSQNKEGTTGQQKADIAVGLRA